MTRAKLVLAIMMLGILIALATASIYMPKMIEWYFEPPSNIGVSCAPSIAWAFHRFQIAQLISVGVGAILGFFVGMRFTRKKPSSAPVPEINEDS